MSVGARFAFSKLGKLPGIVREEIDDLARETGIPKDILHGLIIDHSQGSPLATSETGGRGLTGVDTKDPGNMTGNLRRGIGRFADLMRYYSGDPTRAAAAYKYGKAKVPRPADFDQRMDPEIDAYRTKFLEIVGEIPGEVKVPHDLIDDLQEMYEKATPGLGKPLRKQVTETSEDDDLRSAFIAADPDISRAMVISPEHVDRQLVDHEALYRAMPGFPKLERGPASAMILQWLRTNPDNEELSDGDLLKTFNETIQGVVMEQEMEKFRQWHLDADKAAALGMGVGELRGLRTTQPIIMDWMETGAPYPPVTHRPARTWLDAHRAEPRSQQETVAEKLRAQADEIDEQVEGYRRQLHLSGIATGGLDILGWLPGAAVRRKAYNEEAMLHLAYEMGAPGFLGPGTAKFFADMGTAVGMTVGLPFDALASFISGDPESDKRAIKERALYTWDVLQGKRIFDPHDLTRALTPKELDVWHAVGMDSDTKKILGLEGKGTIQLRDGLEQTFYKVPGARVASDMLVGALVDPVFLVAFLRPSTLTFMARLHAIAENLDPPQVRGIHGMETVLSETSAHLPTAGPPPVAGPPRPRPAGRPPPTYGPPTPEPIGRTGFLNLDEYFEAAGVPKQILAELSHNDAVRIATHPGEIDFWIGLADQARKAGDDPVDVLTSYVRYAQGRAIDWDAYRRSNWLQHNLSEKRVRFAKAGKELEPDVWAEATDPPPRSWQEERALGQPDADPMGAPARTAEEVVDQPVGARPAEEPTHEVGPFERPPEKPPVAEPELEVPRYVPEGTDVSKELPTGNSFEMITPSGKTVQGHYALVEGKKLVTSHDGLFRKNAAYPQDLQRRSVDRTVSMERIRKIGRELDPRRLADNPMVTDGAPVVGPDLVVEAGNHRTLGILKAPPEVYANYRKFLMDNAARLGLDPEDIGKMKKPVLVRVRDAALDRVAFADDANVSTVARLSAVEQAAQDADRLTPDMLTFFEPGESGDILAASNRRFVQEFIKSVPVGERPELMTRTGAASQSAVTRIRNALFAKAYGDEGMLARLAESTDDDVRNITNSLVNIVPRALRFKSLVAQGKRTDLDISTEVALAARKYASLKQANQAVPLYLRNQNLFGDELGPTGRRLLALFHNHSRSKKKITGFLDEYYRQADELGNPQQVSIFEGPPPTKEQVFSAALRVADVDAESINSVVRQAAGEEAPPSSRAEAAGQERLIGDGVSDVPEDMLQAGHPAIQKLADFLPDETPVPSPTDPDFTVKPYQQGLRALNSFLAHKDGMPSGNASVRQLLERDEVLRQMLHDNVLKPLLTEAADPGLSTHRAVIQKALLNLKEILQKAHERGLKLKPNEQIGIPLPSREGMKLIIGPEMKLPEGMSLGRWYDELSDGQFRVPRALYDGTDPGLSGDAGIYLDDEDLAESVRIEGPGGDRLWVAIKRPGDREWQLA